MPIFEVTNLRIAVKDADIAAAPPSVTTDDGDSARVMTDSGEHLSQGWVEVIPGVSLSLSEGESLALVGESASGKSLILMGGFGLLTPGARVIGGETRYGDLTYLPWEDRLAPDTEAVGKRKMRPRGTSKFMADIWDEDWAYAIGTDVGFLFQDAVGSWTPVHVIGEQSGEAIGYHEDLSQDEIDRGVFDALGEVKLPKSKRFFNAFSVELSRGMAQRAMLAAALTKSPHLLIADEPLNGLDAPIAMAIMDLIIDMKDRGGMAMIMVTHDLAAVARVADRIAVVYGGIIIEEASAVDIFHRPKHPYTSGLIGSIPSGTGGRLRSIPGEAQRLVDVDRSRCVFVNRCEFVVDRCRTEAPVSVTVGDSNVVCHRATELDLPGIKD
jgi:oligopeptide/dipeptide ABC transporter ATP-binding protein